ncbi:MAG: Hsp20/alpha crystallin family protein [Kiritimatiellae bacterium]|nr:Hsp20/alpha crystallin family protein [Kiritimatiellia bacterium]
MSVLTELNPWNLLDTLLDTNNRVFRNERFPPVNVYLDDNATIIDVELPGKTSKDVDLTLESQAVVIADRPADTVDERCKPAAAKPAWSRRLELPFRVDHDKANAKFVNGILRIELPRADAVASHRIKIG